MSTSIRVSDDTRAKLAALKREEETFDELLARLASYEAPMEAGAWAGTDRPDRAREAIRRSRERFER